MKKTFTFLMILTFTLFSLISILSAAELNNSPRTDTTKTSDQTTATIKVTIVKIDVSTNTVVVKDRGGKIYEFTVDPKYGIDLRKYKVGDIVTATISTTTTADKVTRARISKTDLLKLQ